MTESDRLRKAAILIDTLDTTRADALLDQMPETQRDRIRQMVMELEDVTDAERERVIAEFLGPEAAARLRNNEAHRATAGSNDDVVVEFSSSATMDIVDFDQSQTIPNVPPSAFQTAGNLGHAEGMTTQPSDWALYHNSTGYHSTGHHSTGQDSTEDSPHSAASHFNHLAGACQPFSFLQGMEADALAACLEYENPQAIALVVSQLDPEQAARVVACFTTRMQSDVVRRMSRLQDAEPEVLLDLEDYLRQRLASTLQQPESTSDGPGVRALVRMLEVAGPVERRGLLANLAEDRPALARHLARQFDIEPKSTSEPSEDELATTFAAPAMSLNDGASLQEDSWTASFPVSLESQLEMSPTLTSNQGDVETAGEHAWMVSRPSVASWPAPSSDREDTMPVPLSRPDVTELAELDTRSLATLLQHAEPETLLIALAGAPRTVVDALMKCLSRREARKLRSRIEKIGPIRIDDIEFAQQRLIQLANELVEEGLIKLRRQRRSVTDRRVAA